MSLNPKSSRGHGNLTGNEFGHVDNIILTLPQPQIIHIVTNEPSECSTDQLDQKLLKIIRCRAPDCNICGQFILQFSQHILRDHPVIEETRSTQNHCSSRPSLEQEQRKDTEESNSHPTCSSSIVSSIQPTVTKKTKIGPRRSESTLNLRSRLSTKTGTPKPQESTCKIVCELSEVKNRDCTNIPPSRKYDVTEESNSRSTCSSSIVSAIQGTTTQKMQKRPGRSGPTLNFRSRLSTKVTTRPPEESTGKVMSTTIKNRDSLKATTFSALSSLKRKQDVLTNKFKCGLCEKKFHSRLRLKVHTRTHSKDKPKKKYKCVVCLKEYSTKQGFESHEMSHTGEKPFHCRLCWKKFSDQKDLNSHSQIHARKKEFKCNICLREFSWKNHLESHIRGHTGERPFKCLICEKSFHQSSHLTSHVRSHTGEKPYQCDICFKSFGFSSSLKRHTVIHWKKRDEGQC